MVRQQQHEPVEALLLFEHVHGQHQPVATDFSATHAGVVKDPVQVLQNGRELGEEGYGCGVVCMRVKGKHDEYIGGKLTA